MGTSERPAAPQGKDGGRSTRMMQTSVLIASLASLVAIIGAVVELLKFVF